MSCTLRIQFSGLNLLVQHRTDQGRVRVLMPNGRLPNQGAGLKHLDGKTAVPHVGYLRADGASVVPGLPGGPAAAGTPPFEMVYQFAHEELVIEYDAADQAAPRITDKGTIALPNFRGFASKVRIRRDALSGVPKAGLPSPLLRLDLVGGTFASKPHGSLMRMPSGLHGIGLEHKPEKYAGVVEWSRPLQGQGITLHWRAFGTTAPTKSLRLVSNPASGHEEIVLKVANLCGDNPLEWPGLKLRTLMGDSDDDFKWLYQLYAKEGSDDPTTIMSLLPSGTELPVPQKADARLEGIADDCSGGTDEDDF
jgi:hypothetical protein